MNPALWVAKTGLEAQQTRMTVVANNLANANTMGFKRDRAVFEDLLYQNVRQAGAQTSDATTLPSGLSVGTGVRVVATEKTHSQGNVIQTSRPLDVAVEGRGFFQVLKPDGTLAYTRDGQFQVDADGQLVTSSGYPIQPSITIPSDAMLVTIGRDGTVSVTQPGNATATQVGTLQMVDFINPTGLQPVGQNLYHQTGASGDPQIGTAGLNGLGLITQGSLETSNVNVVEELVDMIESQRAYEMNSKAVSAADEMLRYLSNQL